MRIFISFFFWSEENVAADGICEGKTLDRGRNQQCQLQVRVRNGTILRRVGGKHNFRKETELEQKRLNRLHSEPWYKLLSRENAKIFVNLTVDCLYESRKTDAELYIN